MIIINFKNYTSGAKALELAKLIQSHDLHAMVAVPAPEIKTLSTKTGLEVYAQHVDYIKDEKTTGFISAQDVKAQGASGTLLNHSEHRLTPSLLKKTIEQCKKAKLMTVVCAHSVADAKAIAAFRPHVIAFEDPTLIASGRSITEREPKEVKKFVAMLKGKPIIPLCGAGISSMDDVEAAYALGCKGILIASAIAHAPKPKVEAFLKALGEFEFS